MVEYMEEHGYPTLRAIAEVLDVPLYRLYKETSKNKDDGKWNVVENFINTRLSYEYPNANDVIDSALRIDASNKEFASQIKSRMKDVSVIIDNGEMYPARDNQDAVVGSIVLIRYDPALYNIVYQSKTHSVLQEINDLGETVSEKLYCFSNSTLNNRTVPTIKFASEYEKRCTKMRILRG